MKKLLILSFAFIAQLLPSNAFGLFEPQTPETKKQEDKKQEYLELLRPKIEFPESFEFSISTDDYGLNVTELVYFDKKAKKIRI